MKIKSKHEEKQGGPVMFCPGSCKHLDRKRRRCLLTGKPLGWAWVTILGHIYLAFEHKWVCTKVGEKQNGTA